MRPIHRQMVRFASALATATVFSIGCSPSGEKSPPPPPASATPPPPAKPAAQVDPSPAEPAAEPDAAAGTGALTARVLYGGPERPRRKVLDFNADQWCARANPDKVGSEQWIVSRDLAVKNAVVHATSAAGKQEYPVPANTLLLDQNGCMYAPHVLDVHVGQKIVVRNSDATLHNIHSFAARQRSFNFAQPREGDTREISFSRPEFVKVKCDVHPWMSAFIAVFDHPYHAVTEKNGTCTITDLPPGTYAVNAWHEKAGDADPQTVTIVAGQTTTIEFKFE